MDFSIGKLRNIVKIAMIMTPSAGGRVAMSDTYRNFFMIANEMRIILTDGNFGTLGLYRQGVLYNNRGQSCTNIGTIYPEVSTSTLSLIDDPLIEQYNWNQLTAPITPTLILMNLLDLTFRTDTTNTCSMPTGPGYLLTPSTVPIVLDYIIGEVKTFNIEISWLVVQKLCISVDEPTLTYSKVSDDYLGASPFSVIGVQFKIDGTVIGTSVNQLVNLITVQGMLTQTVQTASFQIQATGTPNTPPSFVTPFSATDFLLYQGDQVIIAIPDIYDPNTLQTITLTTIPDPLPDFIALVTDYMTLAKSLVITTTSQTPLGDYLISLVLSDGIDTITSPQLTISILQQQQLSQEVISSINITNQAAPHFEDDLIPTISLTPGVANYQILPQIVDQDGDEYEVIVNFKEAQLYSKYNNLLNRLEFYPPVNILQKASYQSIRVQINLKDNSKVNTYFLTVLIKAVQKTEVETNQTTKVIKYKLEKPTKDGQVRLRIIDQSLYVSNLISRQLNESEFTLTLSGKTKVNFTFEIDKDQIKYGYIKIQVQFENPAAISIQQADWLEIESKYQMVIQIEGSTFLYLVNKGTKSNIELPYQNTDEQIGFIKQVQQAATGIQLTMIPGSIILNIFFQAALNLLWSMLNDLSFIINLTLVSIQIPGVAQPIMNIILQFIYLDVLQTDKWLNPIFENQFKEADQEDEGLSLFFQQSGFQSMIIFKNLGSTLIFTIVMISLYLIQPLLGTVAVLSPKLSVQNEKLKGSLYWNSGIRFIIQQFQPLLIASLINLYYLKTDTVLNFLSTLGSLSMLGLLGLCIASIFKMINSGNNEKLEKYAEPLVQGINMKSSIGKFWMPIILFKWGLLSLILVTLRDHAGFQLMLLSLVQIPSQALLILGQPNLTAAENWMSLFNEVMASIYLYGLFTLTDYMGSNELKEECGLFLLVIVLFTISANIIKVLIGMYQLINFTKLSYIFKNKDAVVAFRPITPPIQISSVKVVKASVPIKPYNEIISQLDMAKKRRKLMVVGKQKQIDFSREDLNC
ncbi:hypothetical protein FGO68_gene17292 [Halteria grandinella]|uniref:TRP C-terminal domain-containing protein n=1 Tax=Halteria grandinella TaxID=5974 RepID=A0A8J8P5F4_HALGN|nr:hypothetical protein FGO68_gene17292 [Halteria grandinella]